MRRAIAGLLVAVTIASGCGSDASKSSSGGSVVAPARTAEELAVAWWEWASIEPDATNPVTDTTGEDCARNQPADVWFLAGDFGGAVTRTCNVPAGRPVFFPVLNIFCLPAGKSCAGKFDSATVSATLDGATLTPVDLTVDAPALHLGAGGVVSKKAGTFHATVNGWWVLMPGLSAGTHTLEFEGQDPSGFELAVSYTLTVV